MAICNQFLSRESHEETGKVENLQDDFLLMIKFSKDDDWSDLTHCASDWLVSPAFVSWVQV